MFNVLAFFNQICIPPYDEEFLFVFVVAAAGGVAAGFLAVLFTSQFSGYRPTIEIPAEQELVGFMLTDQFGRPFMLSSIKSKALIYGFCASLFEAL
jgi:cytochrome oxidase Cu insertion factor (SCO1/SenC/PrrC family)